MLICFWVACLHRKFKHVIPPCSRYVFLSSVSAYHVQANDFIWKNYHVDINLFSLRADNPLDTYHWHGSSSTSGGMVGLCVSDETRRFDVDIKQRITQGLFLVEVTVKPNEKDNLTQPNSYQLDLSLE